MTKLGAALSVLLLVAGAASPAVAQTSAKDRARKHFAKGFAYYQNGEYLKAVKELRVAYVIRPVPVVMFYIGKTYQAAGLSDEAARAFWKFLDEATLNNSKRAEAVAALKQMGKPATEPKAGIGEPVTPPTRVVEPTTRPRVVRRPRRAVKPGQIIHEPVEDARPKRPMTLEAELPEDFGDWARLYLYYRPKGHETFIKKPMKADQRSIYHGCVPARHMMGSSIQYYIEAMGRTGKRKAGSGNASSPNIIALSESAPLQAGGRLKGCPDEAGGGTGPGVTPEDPRRVPGYLPVTPGNGAPKVSSRRLKLYGFIGASAASVAAIVVGVVLNISARGKAQEMANAGAHPQGQTPLVFFDGEVERIEKQGKALDAGAIVCYVLGAVAAGGAIYLGLDLWVLGKKKESAHPTSVTDSLRIAPTIGPNTFGLSGGFEF